ncbi:MAG: tetratricopeptide repeat protein [Chitinophagaceae bacterium]
MKKPQLILAGIGLSLVVLLFVFGQFTPKKDSNPKKADGPAAQMTVGFTADSALLSAKKTLTSELISEAENLEKQLSQSKDSASQLAANHELAHFWQDKGRLFEPYAWYEAEAARLENSEKSLTFAARLFLENLQEDSDGPRRQWKAMQAKELYERSLKINPNNDSARVGIGSCYLFGNISNNPMEGIALIREVVAKDSTNVYAQLTLVKGSILSGQYEKGIDRLLLVTRTNPENIEAILLLAELYERTGDKKNAVVWYEKSVLRVQQPEIRQAIRDRIKELKK